MRIHPLDLSFRDAPGIIAAYLIESGGAAALVESGPGSTLTALVAAIEAHGVRLRDIRQVFITHVHLDHCGAAGWWAGQGARIYCHPSAARHLIDPSRLLQSAQMVYGDAMDALWGTMIPTPADQVTVLADNESVQVGDTVVTALSTPGHARHHHAYQAGGACFTGDVAGLRLDRANYISVTAAPPQFEPDAYLASIDRLAQAGFSQLYLTHFGAIDDPASHWRLYRQAVQRVHSQVAAWVAEGCDDSEIRRRYLQAEHAEALSAGVSEALWQRYELGNPTSMCADGIRLSVQKSLQGKLQ